MLRCATPTRIPSDLLRCKVILLALISVRMYGYGRGACGRVALGGAVF